MTQTERQRCMAGAVTHTSREECDRRAREDTQKHIDDLFGRLGADTAP